MVRVGVRRLVVRQPRRHAGVGQPAAADRHRRRPRPRADGALAVQYRADSQRGRLREVRAPHAGHRLRVVRLAQQQRAAAAVHDQSGAAATDAAAGHHRWRGPDLLRQRRPGLAADDGLAVQRAPAPLRLRQRDAAGRHPAVHQLRHVGDGVGDQRPASCSRTTGRRSTPTRRGAACSRWRSRRATRSTATATSTASSRAATSTSSRSRPTPWATSG